MIGRLKCWLGLHAWSEHIAWDDDGADLYACRRCGREEYQP